MHKCFDGADRTIAQLGDLLVGQLPILPEEKHFFLLRPKVYQSIAEALDGFLVFQSLRGRGMVHHRHGIGALE